MSPAVVLEAVCWRGAGVVTVSPILSLPIEADELEVIDDDLVRRWAECREHSGISPVAGVILDRGCAADSEAELDEKVGHEVLAFRAFDAPQTVSALWVEVLVSAESLMSDFSGSLVNDEWSFLAFVDSSLFTVVI